MFDRWRKGNQVSGVECPLCGQLSPEGTEECSRCYYQLAKSAFQQDDAAEDEVSTELFDELTSEHVDEDEDEIVDWTRHSFDIDEVTIAVDQYDEDSDAVELSGSPSFASFGGVSNDSIGPQKEQLEDGEYELSPSDAPKDVERFVVPDYKMKEELAEIPTHTVDLVVPLLPKGAEPNDDDEGPLVDPSEVPDTAESIEEEEKPKASTPTLPAPPGNEASVPAAVEAPKLPVIPASTSQNGSSLPPSVSAPELPEQPNLRPPEEAFDDDIDIDVGSEEESVPSLNQGDQLWPWMQKEPYDDLAVRRDLRQVMELVKAGELEDAERALDALGPHLGVRMEIIFHVGVVLKKLGREEALRRMLETARRLHPEDQHVATALTSLGM